MAARSDQAAHQQQHHQQQQQDQQQSSTLLGSPRLTAALLGHHSVCQDLSVLLALLQSCKQLQAEAAAQCAGQLAVNVTLREQQAVAVPSFAAWLQHHAGLLRELHVEFRCLRSDGSAVLQCLQEQQQQLQALQCLALDNSRSSYNGGLQDGWADPLLPHLPVGLRRLQLTGSGLAMQQGALAAFSRLQQLTQLSFGFWSTSALQHIPTGLRSLDITGCRDWDEAGQDALAPLARLQQLTELRLGKVQPEQLGQLPPALQQLDLVLAVDTENLKQVAAWFQQHAGILRRLVLDSGFKRAWRHWDEDDGGGSNRDRWAVPLASVAAAFEAAATAPAAAAPGQAAATPAAAGAAAQPATPVTDSTPNTSSSSSSGSFTLQSLCALNMPWVLNGDNLRTLAACSLTELECYIDFKSEQAVGALRRLTKLRSLHVSQNVYDGDSLFDQHDSAVAPLSALLQLTRLQLPYVRPQQLEQLQLPRLQQLIASVARCRRDADAADHGFLPVDLSHFSSLTHLEVSSDTLLQCNTFPGSLRKVTWRFFSSRHRVPEADTDSRLSMQPLLQLGRLESLSFEFNDLRTDMCHSGLLHELRGGFWQADSHDERDVWRMAASTAEQGVAGGPEPAAAGVLWGCMPLKSVRLAVDKVQHGFVKMPQSAVQALGALPLTELDINGGGPILSFLHLGLDVTPAQLGAVLQRLPLLQHLQLNCFAMLCDESAVATTEAQQQQQLDVEQQQPENQQQGMQSYHSAAGVIALISAVDGLLPLQKLQLLLPLQLQPAAAKQVAAALDQLPNVILEDAEQFGMWLRNPRPRA
jgi:hypothetical protein